MYILFIIIAIAVIILTVYFTMKKSLKCPDCRSEEVEPTGRKEYKEDPPIALWGSPDSYHRKEYKCNQCGRIFMEKEKAVIVN